MAPRTARAGRLDEAAAAERQAFETEVLAGLSADRKMLPCRFFYDARGSELFEKITGLPEYYPMRAETAILRAHAPEIGAAVPDGVLLVEFGSGSSTKTEILLGALNEPAAYVPIDVSESALTAAAVRLSRRFPRLRTVPVIGDFGGPVALPGAFDGAPRLGFFPGSTIGNFTPDRAASLLRHLGGILGTGSRLIVGADLRKDVRRLLDAYDDPAGVTAAFNLNLLARINRELGGDFDTGAFAHEAAYDTEKGRIEMRLVSRKRQWVRVGRHRFLFQEGERIHTENSYKYTVDGFRELARQAGWEPAAAWSDPEALFSVHDLVRIG